MEEYDIIRILKALSDKTRQDILEMLIEDEMNVTDICSLFRVSQPTVSHHLQILKGCELVNFRKEGKNIYYFARQDTVNGAFGVIARKLRVRIIRKK